ncbi:MAG: hypothetical protein ACE5DQ_02685 [Candidatus Paceibacterota bacterium]
MIDPDDLYTYKWSSFPDYISEEDSFINTKPVLGIVKGGENYKRFVLNQAEYQQSLQASKTGQ